MGGGVSFTFKNGDPVTFPDTDDGSGGRVILPPERLYKLSPHVKPVGPVEVDKNNALAQGLYRVFLFRPEDVSTGGDLYDHVKKEVLPKGATKTPSIETTIKGPSLIGGGEGSTDWIHLGIDRKTLMGIPSNEIEALFSITVIGRIDSITTRDGLFHFGYNSTYGCMMNAEFTTENVIRFSAYQYNGNLVDAPFTLGEWFIVTATMRGVSNGTSTFKIYLDGIEADSGSDTQSSGVSTDCYIGTTFGDSRCMDGDMAAMFIHNRLLEAGEVEKLHKDPYQFLKPAVPQTQIITDPVTADDRVWLS